MSARLVHVVVVSLLAAAHGRAARAQPVPAPAAPAAASAPNDYSDPKAWLCRPGRQDACAVDLTTTVVAGDGRLTRETAAPRADAPIDCFYVYPTISTDPTPNSDMTADPAELNVVRQQFARFGSVCRPFAPLYRQVTLAGLRQTMAGGALSELGRGLAYDDVREAWRSYLARDNQGRGVVLVGHSQGSFILAELIRQEIEGKPVQSRLVSAILLGTTVAVPRGRDVGGTFASVPLCRDASQVGCVIVYASYRSTLPPPANTLFGHVAEAGMEAACTNPAALGGGSGDLHAYLARDGRTIVGVSTPKPWVVPEAAIDTPWVSVPGLLTARCASNEHAGFLEVTVHGNPADPRTDDITGDLGVGPQIAANWGLHLIDVNLAMGNLVDIVGRQAKAYAARPARAAAAVPDVVASARQLVLVVTPDWDDVRGVLRRFARDGAAAPWREVGGPVDIVVGRKGLAWDPGVDPAVPGPRKSEGDGRSPSGAFALGTAFGYAPASGASWLHLPYRRVTAATECVDDASSRMYNQIVDRTSVSPDWASSEKMREAGEAYRWGVVVEYNTRPAVPDRGSCIFLHISEALGAPGRPIVGTAGCTAMSADALQTTMTWLDPAARPAMVQLPRAALERLHHDWRLP